MDAGPVLDRLASEMGLVTHVGAAGNRLPAEPTARVLSARRVRADRPHVAADPHARAARWSVVHDDAESAAARR